MRLLIAEPDGFSPNALALLRQRWEVDCRPLTQAEVRAALSKYDAIWVRLHLQIRAAEIPGDLRCKYVLTATTGVDHLDVDALEARGVTVLSLRGQGDFLATISATAELTLGLILALVRKIPQAYADVCAGHWRRDLFRSCELQGRTAGIIGLGRLGRKVAVYLNALGMKVIYFDPFVQEGGSGATPVATLPGLLELADLVTVHVPLNEQTRHLLNSAAFAFMKPGAWFVNTSRGPVVDEQALLGALESGRLAGAAVDVLEGEPHITRDHPLLQYARAHHNLLITPHIGGAAMDAMARCETFLAGQLNKIVLGTLGAS